MKKDKKGFTLIELLILIAIIGILMAVIVPHCAKQNSNKFDNRVKIERSTQDCDCPCRNK